MCSTNCKKSMRLHNWHSVHASQMRKAMQCVACLAVVCASLLPFTICIIASSINISNRVINRVQKTPAHCDSGHNCQMKECPTYRSHKNGVYFLQLHSKKPHIAFLNEKIDLICEFLPENKYYNREHDWVLWDILLATTLTTGIIANGLD